MLYLSTCVWQSYDCHCRLNHLEQPYREPPCEILHFNFRYVSSHSDISSVPTRTVHTDRRRSHPIDIRRHKPHRRGQNSSDRPADDRNSLTALPHRPSFENKQPRLAIYGEILAVVLENIVASEPVSEEVVGPVDDSVVGVGDSERAGASTGFGEEVSGVDGVLEAVQDAAG